VVVVFLFWEGKFSSIYKEDRHPHTNDGKSSLNI